jgi:hypothetical protein
MSLSHGWVVALCFSSLACGRVDDGEIAADAQLADTGPDVDPSCLDVDGGCKSECRGYMHVVDIYAGCARRIEVIGCSQHEGTCTPPDRCLYDPKTGAVATVLCSAPPPGWIDCPEGEWFFQTAERGTCSPSGAPGTCVATHGAEGSSEPCAPGRTCTATGCVAEPPGPIVPCGSIKCACTCTDPSNSRCECS